MPDPHLATQLACHLPHGQPHQTGQGNIKPSLAAHLNPAKGGQQPVAALHFPVTALQWWWEGSCKWHLGSISSNTVLGLPFYMSVNTHGETLTNAAHNFWVIFIVFTCELTLKKTSEVYSVTSTHTQLVSASYSQEKESLGFMPSCLHLVQRLCYN